jgi:hypothetical protein
MIDDVVDALPREVQLRIAKMAASDMDTRIAMGCIGRLRVPNSVVALLSGIARPSRLGANSFGVRIDRHVVFRGIVGRDCHDFVAEKNSRTVVFSAGDACRVDPCWVDFWWLFFDAGGLIAT